MTNSPSSDCLHRPVPTTDIRTTLDGLADSFVAFAHDMERQFRRRATSLPTEEELMAFTEQFWRLIDGTEAATTGFPAAFLQDLRRRQMERVGPVLWRSQSIYRSYFKPHGYAGDFRMIELMYELEASAGTDPTQPALVNCLDRAYGSIASVQAVWERRHRLAQMLTERSRSHGALRVLDVACGGARYLADALRAMPEPGRVCLTLVDQDPAALAYAKRVTLASWWSQVTAHCVPIASAASRFSADRFDVVICSGLFDYLETRTAQAFLGALCAAVAPGGSIAITNFASGERSAFCKGWFGDWILVYRTDDEVLDLFPGGVDVALDHSTNGSLIFAVGTRP